MKQRINPEEVPARRKNYNTTIHSHAEGDKREWENSGYIEIIHVLEGILVIGTKTKEYEFYPGETAVIKPYTRLTVSTPKGGRSQSFVFDNPRYFDDIGIPALHSFDFHIGKDETISFICKKVNEEYENQSYFHESMLIALTTQLLIHLYRNYSEVPQGDGASLTGKQKIVREALEYIYSNCQKGISTCDISEYACVSSSYLCRCFKQVCGVSPLEYAERIRCRKAMEDLSRGNSTVYEVALKYNFSSVSYFSRRYKKYCGISPSKTLSDALKNRFC